MRAFLLILVGLILQLTYVTSVLPSTPSSPSYTLPLSSDYAVNITHLYTGKWQPVGDALSHLLPSFAGSSSGGPLFLMIDTRPLLNSSVTGCRATIRIYNTDEDTSTNSLMRWLLYGTYNPTNGYLRVSSDLSAYPDGSLGFNYSEDAQAYKNEGKTFIPCSKCVLSLNALPLKASTQSTPTPIQFALASADDTPATHDSTVIFTSTLPGDDIVTENDWLSTIQRHLSPSAHVARMFPSLGRIASQGPSLVEEAEGSSSFGGNGLDMDDAESMDWTDLAAQPNTDDDSTTNTPTIQASVNDFQGSFESQNPANTTETIFSLALTSISPYDVLEVARVMNYVLMAGGVSMGQYFLIRRQLLYSESQARMMKVSLWSIFIFGLIDFLFFTMHYSIAFMNTTLFTYFLVLAVGGFAVFFQELKFMLSMWKVRHPESFNQGAEHTHREFRKLAFRFTMILLLELLLVKFIPSIESIAVFAYLFWVPQIVLNAKEDIRNALQPAFIVLWSLFHLVLPLYMLYCPVNIFGASTQPAIAWTMVSVVVVQVIILLLQDKLGPRFFVPARFLPKKYDYHRPIPLRRVATSSSSTTATRPARTSTRDATDIEAPLVSSSFIDSSSDLPSQTGSLNAGSSDSTSATTASATDGLAAAVGATTSNSSSNSAGSDESKRSSAATEETETESEDVCPICYCEFDPNGSRFLTMVTPCDHVFHTGCLSQWMEQKMECPTCRGPLPPV